MGTVNGLESEDTGPDINTQRLILPAGRQWEKDTGTGGGWGGSQKETSCRGEQGPFSLENKTLGPERRSGETAHEVAPRLKKVPQKKSSSVLKHCQTPKSDEDLVK